MPITIIFTAFGIMLALVGWAEIRNFLDNRSWLRGVAGCVLIVVGLALALGWGVYGKSTRMRLFPRMRDTLQMDADAVIAVELRPACRGHSYTGKACRELLSSPVRIRDRTKILELARIFHAMSMGAPLRKNTGTRWECRLVIHYPGREVAVPVWQTEGKGTVVPFWTNFTTGWNLGSYHHYALGELLEQMAQEGQML